MRSLKKNKECESVYRAKDTKRYSPLTRYQNGLGDDQPNTTLDALHIILFHELAWVGVCGAISGDGRHHESVLQGGAPDLERGEKSLCGHFKCSREKIFECGEGKLDCSLAMIPCFYTSSVISIQGSKDCSSGGCKQLSISIKRVKSMT